MSGSKIEGAIDMHCRFGPVSIGTTAHIPHAMTGLEAAREAFETALSRMVAENPARLLAL